jgi:UDP-N-acetylmuramoyl-tripeptide--D-alanyl-D-alanine ligase
MDKPSDQLTVWTADELAQVTGGSWLTEVPQGWAVKGVAVSRKWCRAGDLFVTMDKQTWDRAEEHQTPSRASRWDTANRLSEIRDRGAVGAIVQRDVAEIPDGFPVLRVDDSWDAVTSMAELARERFKGRLIAVTGTSGKSTTREMIRHCLSPQGPTRATIGNYNTRAGVPLTLAQLSAELDYAVLEMAVSSLYMKRRTLADTVKPHVAVITSIGAGQIKDVTTAKNTAVFKSRIFEGLSDDGTAIITRDTEYFDLIRSKAESEGAARIWAFGDGADCALRLIDAELDPAGSTVTADIAGKIVRYRLPVPGQLMIQNSLAVLGAVAAVGGDVTQAASDLDSYKTLEGRLERHQVAVPGGFFELIDDSYNATQLSMQAGFEVLSLTQSAGKGRKIAVLGRIVYLEDRAEEIHRSLAKPLIASGISKVFTIGDEMKYLRNVLPPELLGKHARNALELAKACLAEVRPGDVVLLKGSRRNSDFDKVSEYLRVRWKPSLPANGSDASVTPPRADNRSFSRITEATERRRMSIEKPWKEGFRIGLLGDTYFGEFYQEGRERKGGENILKKRGYGYSLEAIQPFVSSCDFNIANLEAALTEIAESSLAVDKGWVLKGNPGETTKALSNAGIDAVALGNNHSIDYGLPGLADTLDSLEKSQIHWFGVGSARNQAMEPLVLNLAARSRSYSIAFLSAYHYRKRYKEMFSFYATDQTPGVAMLEDLPAAIQNLASIHEAVVVLPHWGQNYKWRSELQTRQARELTDAGATTVIGHGAHMAQEVDFEGNSWVAYSLGNYVFNSFGEYAKRGVPPISLLACLELTTRHGALEASLRLYPVISDNLRTEFQPRFATGGEAEEFWKILRSRNSLLALDSEYAAYEIDEFGPCLILNVL